MANGLVLVKAAAYAFLCTLVSCFACVLANRFLWVHFPCACADCVHPLPTLLADILPESRRIKGISMSSPRKAQMSSDGQFGRRAEHVEKGGGHLACAGLATVKHCSCAVLEDRHAQVRCFRSRPSAFARACQLLSVVEGRLS